MMAMVDTATGVVYWVPTSEYQYHQGPVLQPSPGFAPVVMPYRLLRPIAPVMAAPVPVPVPVPVVVNTTVFVRGVPREATTQMVESHFNVHGDIVSCHVIRHKDASTNKGIAFVKFHDHAAAQRAIDGNSPGVMEQREIFAEWAHPKPATSASRPVPDQPITPEFIPLANAPHLCLAPPTTHLINSPSYFPASSPVMPAFTFTNTHHLPWIVTPSSSSSSSSPPPAPYHQYAPYNYNVPSIHVLGFPHPNYSFNYVPPTPYGQEISIARPPFNHLLDYNPGNRASTPPTVSEETTPSIIPEEISSTSESRKGKEHSDDS